jgi:two-component system, cell cycle response regulator DivK
MNLDFRLTASQPATAKCPLVLAVDDDDDSLLLLTKVLELLECSSIVANSGRATLSLARSRQPDLILLDILLPDLHGVEVIRALKRNPSTANIPIVALTALARIQDQQDILAAGGDRCLIKPYLLDDLEATIRYYVGCQSSLSIA